MKLELDPELIDLLHKQVQPGSTKKTTTASPPKHRPYNHFPMGKTGFVPQRAGQGPYSSHWRR